MNFNIVPAADVSDAYLKASMSDAKILDGHDDKYEFQWCDDKNKELEGKLVSKSLFESKFADSSDVFTASDLFSPAEPRDPHQNVVESPSLQREMNSSRSFSNDVADPFMSEERADPFINEERADPFMSEERDVSHGTNLSISSTQEEKEPSQNLFHPREDRIGLQLSAETAQAMLPPNACVFVAK